MPRIHRIKPERPRPLRHLCRLPRLFNMSEPGRACGRGRLILNEPPQRAGTVLGERDPEHRPAPLQAQGRPWSRTSC